MIRSKDGNGCRSTWCCCIRQQVAELWQRIEGTVRGIKMNGSIIEPDGDGIVDLDVNFPVDGAMDPASTNPVQNRVVTDAILTERSERIDDDRRHDLQIQGLQTEVQTKLTTPSGGVQGQVLGKGAQGIGWVDTITEAQAQQIEEDIASVDGRLVREIADREAADTALGQRITEETTTRQLQFQVLNSNITRGDNSVRNWVMANYQGLPSNGPTEGYVFGYSGGTPMWIAPPEGGVTIRTFNNVEISLENIGDIFTDAVALMGTMYCNTPDGAYVKLFSSIESVNDMHTMTQGLIETSLSHEIRALGRLEIAANGQPTVYMPEDPAGMLYTTAVFTGAIFYSSTSESSPVEPQP